MRRSYRSYKPPNCVQKDKFRFNTPPNCAQKGTSWFNKLLILLHSGQRPPLCFLEAFVREERYFIISVPIAPRRHDTTGALPSLPRLGRVRRIAASAGEEGAKAKAGWPKRGVIPGLTVPHVWRALVPGNVHHTSCRSAGFQPAWRPGWPPSQAERRPPPRPLGAGPYPSRRAWTGTATTYRKPPSPVPPLDLLQTASHHAPIVFHERARTDSMLEPITMLCSRPSFLRKQESRPPALRPLDAGSQPAPDMIRGPA